jgi:hypothetical protein
MEIKNAQNKMDIPAIENKDLVIPKSTTISAVSTIKNRYHFPGDGKYFAISIVASTNEEAMELWKIQRQPVKPEPKVAEPEQTNNE